MCCVGHCGDCCVGNCSDCGGKAARDLKARHEKEVADELATKRKEIGERAAKTEKELLDYANSSMNELINKIKVINKQDYGGKSLQINVEQIKAQQAKIEREVNGYVWRVLDNRLQPKDPELKVIIDEMDTEKRNKRFNAFVDKIYLSAQEGLKKAIGENINKQHEVVRREIQNRLDEVEISLKKTQEAYTEILSASKKDTKENETLRTKYMYQHDIYEILEEQIK